MAARESNVRRRSRAVGLAALLLCGAAGAATGGALALLPRDDEIARGLRVAGEDFPAGTSPRAAAQARARDLLARRARLTWGDEVVLEASLAELGATVDVDALAGEIASVGREPELPARLASAYDARQGRVDIPVAPWLRLPVGQLAERLASTKDDRDTPPVSARLDFATMTPTDHRPGRYLDVYAAAEAIQRAVPLASTPTVDVQIPAFEIAPRAPRDVVASLDVSRVVSRFQTTFGYLGGESNRAQNIRRAASQVDGVVLMPGELISFNHLVGPRSEDNGFATAPEIYKGEMREGVGGGTCQVAGTLHAAAFFAGLEILERANHSRPSGYIRMGLDATVVYPTVDLKLRNPYPFPLVVRATVDRGTLAFELLGQEQPASVELSTATIGVAPYKRKVEETPAVAEGKFVLKQKGIRGYSIRKTRTIRLRDGQERVEVTTDVYPPTFEIFLVPPGADVETLLPPPPEETEGDARTAANEPARPAASTE